MGPSLECNVPSSLLLWLDVFFFKCYRFLVMSCFFFSSLWE